MRKNRLTRLTKDMAIILFFSAGIPALIGFLMMYHQVQTINELHKMQSEKVHEQTIGQAEMLFRNIEVSVRWLLETPELIDYVLTPDNLKVFTENRLIGRIEGLKSPIPVKLILTDNQGKILFSFPKSSESMAFVDLNNSDIISLNLPVQIDDQNFQSKSVISKGLIYAFVEKNEVRKVFPNISKISGKKFGDLKIETSTPLMIDSRNLMIYAVSLVVFMILSIGFGLKRARQKIIEPIKVLSKKTLEKTKSLNQKFKETVELNADNELRLLESSFEIYLTELKTSHERQIEIERSQALAKIASQVAHDVRSPLSALNLIIASLKGVEEEKRVVLREATQRINDIANNLLSKNRTHDQRLVPELLPALVDALISEKRIEYRAKGNILIEMDLSESYGAYSRVVASQFKRVLSNLINNSVEAICSNPGNIQIRFERNQELISVIINDNGCGIDARTLNNIIESGGSYGKRNGNGLGVSYAMETLQSWGGKFEIHSECGKGTQVKLYFKQCEAPDWFVEEVRYFQKTFIVDDDQSIHEIWKQRLIGCDLIHIYSGEMLQARIDSLGITEDAFFMVDYDLNGQKHTGLELIAKHRLASKCILVTSHFEDEKVRAKASQLGVKILPKGMSPWVPVNKVTS